MSFTEAVAYRRGNENGVYSMKNHSRLSTNPPAAIEALPHPSSKVNSQFSDAYYADCFVRNTADGQLSTALSAYVAMTSRAPSWINGLLQVRDRMVATLGMSPTHGFSAQPPQTVQPGEPLDFFIVAAVSQNELELQLYDRHFTVSISLYLALEESAQAIYLTSVVTPHTRIGKGYVRLIAPFHRAVVKSMLNRLD